MDILTLKVPNGSKYQCMELNELNKYMYNGEAIIKLSNKFDASI